MEIGRDGRHRLYVETPWKVFGPVYHPHGAGITAWDRDPAYFLSNTTAGILAGDHLSAEIQIQEGGKAQVITPSATKIFSMPEGSASQRIQFHLKPHARLYYHGNQLIPYRNADYRQYVDYRLEGDASLLAIEFFAPGRIAGDEAFAFRRVRVRSRVFIDDRLLLDDRIFADGGRMEDFVKPGVFPSPDRMVMGTLISCNPSLKRQRLNELPAYESVQYTMPEEHLLVGRALVNSVQEAERYFREVIQAMVG